MRRFHLLAGSVLPVRAFGGLSPLLGSTLQGGAQVASRLTTGALPAHAATALLQAFPGLGAPTTTVALLAPMRAFGGVAPNDSGFFWRQCHVVCFAHGHHNYHS